MEGGVRYGSYMICLFAVYMMSDIKAKGSSDIFRVKTFCEK